MMSFGKGNSFFSHLLLVGINSSSLFSVLFSFQTSGQKMPPLGLINIRDQYQQHRRCGSLGRTSKNYGMLRSPNLAGQVVEGVVELRGPQAKPQYRAPSGLIKDSAPFHASHLHLARTFPDLAGSSKERHIIPRRAWPANGRFWNLQSDGSNHQSVLWCFDIG